VPPLNSAVRRLTVRPAKYSRSIGPALVAFPLLVVLSPIFLLAWVGFLAQALLVNLTAWYLWRPEGKRVLIVYSDSTIWKDYFESDLLPRLGDAAIVLNWSHRKRWGFSIAALAFRLYGGRIEFNPAAFVFRPFRRVKVLRYYLPFKEYKRGSPDSVTAVTTQLFELIKIGHVQTAA